MLHVYISTLDVSLLTCRCEWSHRWW